MKSRIIIGAAVAVLAAGGAFWFNANSTTPATSSNGFGAAMAQSSGTAEDPAAKVDTSGIIEMALGAQDAPITIVEYSSFTCPHCADFHEDVLPKIKKNYVETGKVRFVYREAYFSKYDLWASLMARCGGEMRYFGITDILMENQREWLADGEPATVVDNLRKIGLTAGMTNESLDACFKDEDRVTALVSWYQENFTRDDMNSTPSFMINGEKYSNMGYDELSKILDAKLAE